MAKFVPDVNTRRWVIIAPSRSARPQDQDRDLNQKIQTQLEEEFPEKDGYHYSEDCPFCYGHEDRTPPEVYRWGKQDPHDKDWIVRVVPNKYPITDIHEVIIHSPDHVIDIPRFPVEHVEILFQVYRERYLALKKHGQVIIFVNVGAASGASLRHPHSQVVVVPHQINLDVVSIEPVGNIIQEGERFIAWAPDFSQWPWEVWIAPKDCCQRREELEKGRSFGEITDEEIPEFSRMAQMMLQRVQRRFPRMSYNFYIYPGTNWYLRTIPRLVHRAGFELGTGLSVNIADPTTVAEDLRKEEGS